eukprot:485764_1
MLSIVLTFLFYTLDGQTILTPIFGGIGGIDYNVLDQGRIYAILDWGLGKDGIHIRNWHAEEQTVSISVFGSGSIHTPCPGFNLSTNDYITGYKIYDVVDQTLVNGLILYTRNGYNYSCIRHYVGETVYNYSYNYDTYDFWYLTGWNIASGSLIDNIQLQFTKSQLTANPTVVPTTPTFTPTNNPTYHPTYNPTSYPTNQPTINPTHDPTYVPSNYPTSIPTTFTSGPTLYPTQSPTNNPTKPFGEVDDDTSTTVAITPEQNELKKDGGFDANI